MSTSPEVQTAGQEVIQHLSEMESLFASHCKLTFVMRNPRVDDGNMVITSDDMQKVADAVQAEVDK